MQVKMLALALASQIFVVAPPEGGKGSRISSSKRNDVVKSKPDKKTKGQPPAGKVHQFKIGTSEAYEVDDTRDPCPELDMRVPATDAPERRLDLHAAIFAGLAECRPTPATMGAATRFMDDVEDWWDDNYATDWSKGHSPFEGHVDWAYQYLHVIEVLKEGGRPRNWAKANAHILFTRTEAALIVSRAVNPLSIPLAWQTLDEVLEGDARALSHLKRSSRLDSPEYAPFKTHRMQWVVGTLVQIALSVTHEDGYLEAKLWQGFRGWSQGLEAAEVEVAWPFRIHGLSHQPQDLVKPSLIATDVAGFDYGDNFLTYARSRSIELEWERTLLRGPADVDMALVGALQTELVTEWKYMRLFRGRLSEAANWMVWMGAHDVGDAMTPAIIPSAALAAAEQLVEDEIKNLGKLQRKYWSGAGKVKDAERRVTDAKAAVARLRAQDREVEEELAGRRLGQRAVLAAAADVVLCTMNSAIFQGIDFGCLAPETACQGVGTVRPGFEDWARRRNVAEAYDLAIAAVLQEGQLHPVDTCHVEKLLSRTFIDQGILGPKSLYRMAKLFRGLVIADPQARAEEELAYIHSALVGQVNREFEDICESLQRATGERGCRLVRYAERISAIRSGQALVQAKEEFGEVAGFCRDIYELDAAAQNLLDVKRSGGAREAATKISKRREDCVRYTLAIGHVPPI